MRPRARLFHRRELNCLLLWALLCALLLHGQAGAVLRLLGPSHSHRVAALPTSVPALAGAAGASGTTGAVGALIGAGLERLRHWRDDAHARSHAAGLFVHVHQHGEPERHHHAPGDATVVAQGDGGAALNGLDEGAASASAGSLTAPAGLARGLALPAAASARRHWPASGAVPWQDFHRAPPEHPPRA